MVFNLHVYWKAKQQNYIDIAKLILANISQYQITFKKSCPFIICGDFNGTINHPFTKKFIETINTSYSLDLNNSNYLNNFTSFDTKTKNEYGWIDHIFTSGFKILEPTYTLNKINGYEIYYNVEQIVENLIQYKQKLIGSTKLDNKLIQIFNNKKWLSDHKPVFIKLEFE